MDWKTLLAYIAGSVDQELLLRNEYLVTENRILRQQIKGRVHLKHGQDIRYSSAEITGSYPVGINSESHNCCAETGKPLSARWAASSS
jgi:hypothetical protein